MDSFHIEDLLIFDDPALERILNCDGFNLDVRDLAHSVRQAPQALVTRIERNLSADRRPLFRAELARPVSLDEVKAARRRILDRLFWELTYWKTPELYEELIEGERLHPGIFQRLKPDLQGKTVLDAGAGTGRATFECIRHGARLVYAVEPSPGLLHILRRKLANSPASSCVVALQGSFNQIPLETNSVDMALSCSAFTADSAEGGDQGLAELRRVTRPGGKIVLIWPRPPDRDWFVSRGFHYVTLPCNGRKMRVHFSSVESALRCVRHFYPENESAVRYILEHRQAAVPFSVLGITNPPHEYCWLKVE